MVINIDFNEADEDPIRTARLKKKADKGNEDAKKEYKKLLKTKVKKV